MKRRFEFGVLSARFADGIPLLRRLLRVVALAITISGSLVVVLGAVLFVLSQTAIFNRWLAALAESFLRDQLRAELHIGSIEVKLLRGVWLREVALIADGDTVLVAPRIEIGYTPEALLFRTIAARVVLESPRFRLIRYRDSTWNVEHILKPSASPPGEPPSLLVYVRSLELHNATITTDDALSASSDAEGRFDPLHAQLEKLNLGATVLAHLRQRQYSVALDQFTWYDRRSGWWLSRAGGIVELDTAGLRVPTFAVALPHSQIQLEQAALDWSDSVPTYHARVAVFHLDTADSRHVLPPDIRLGRALALDAHVSGTLDRITIHVADLATGSTHLHGLVEVEHLRQEDSLQWNAQVEHSQVYWNDVVSLVPLLKLPTLAALSRCSIEQLRASGTVDSIAGAVRATVTAGELDLQGHLHLGRVPRYHVQGSVRKANLAALDTSLPATNLNAIIEVAAEGDSFPGGRVDSRIRLDSSSIADVAIEAATIAARLDGERLMLDTLDAIFDSRSSDTARMRAAGEAALTWPHQAQLVLECEHLPLSRMLAKPRLPQLLSARVAYHGYGTQLDSLRAQLNADIRELVFQDRAVFPFHLDASLNFDSDGRRLLVLSSPQMEARLRGRYTLAGLGRVVSRELAVTDTLIRQMVAIAQGQSPPRIAAIESRDTLEVAFAFRVQSLSLLAPLLAPTVVEASGHVSGLLTARGSQTDVTVDTIALRQLIVSQPDGFYLASMPMSGALRVGFGHRSDDGRPSVDHARIRLAVDSVLRIGQLRIVRPAVVWEWDGTQVRVATDTAWLENTMPLQVSATITPLGGSRYVLGIENARVGMSSNFSWRLAAPLRIGLAEGRYTIESLQLQHEQSPAKLEASGAVVPSGAEHLYLALRNFDLVHLSALPVLGDVELVQQVGGQVDSLVVDVGGTWEHPHLSIASRITALSYGGITIGDQELTLSYDGANAVGAMTVFAPAGPLQVRTALDVRIRALPLVCSLSPFQLAISHHKPIAIIIQANDLSLATIEPFFPAIAQVRGTASAVLSISGMLPGAIRFDGSAQYDKCEFLVPATNIRYRSRGVLSLTDNVLRLDTVELYNDPSDLVGGMAGINGAVTFRGFQPDQLDVSVRIPGDRGLLVMSNATAAVNSAMYGRLVISTEEDGRMRRLHLTGTVEEPRLGGFLRIEDADISFPPTVTMNVQTSSFRYYKTGEGYLITDAIAVAPRTDTAIGDLPSRQGYAERTPTRLSIAPGFSERLSTAVDVKIRRQMRIKMDFSSVEQLVAFVEQENRADYLRFIREGNRRTELRGTLIVVPSSTYKFYSTFVAGGRLRFTTGAIDNPEVDLQAVYTSERIIGSDNRRETYRVILFITGTKRQPRLRMTYEINGETAPGMRGDSVRIMTNALLLVLFGRTQEELSGGAGGSMATSALDQSVNAARSAAISAFLTNALQGGVIKNVNIDFGSSDVTSLSQARIMLTGQLFGANVTVGGSVADLAQNSQITLDLSVGNTLGIEWLRNLVAQFQATANPGQSLSRQQKQWEFRLGWRVP